MSDGHGSTPDTPSGWAPNQPPPYGDAPGSPWTAPGAGPGAPPPSQPPSRQQDPPPRQPHDRQGSPYQQHDRQDPPYQQHGLQGSPYPYGNHQPPPAMRPGIIPLRPLGLGDILDGAIKLIRSNPKTVLGLSAIAAALGAIPVAIGQAIVLGSLAPVLRGDPSSLENAPDTGFLAQYGISLFSYAVQFVAVVLLSGLLTGILGRAVFGGKAAAGDAWRLTRSRAPTLFGLVAVGVLLLLIPMILLAGLLIALDTTGTGTGAGTLVLDMLWVLGLIAYACFACFIITRLAFAASAAVMERRGVIDSLRRSWQLVSGGFWRTLGILLLTLIITLLVSNVLAFPFTLAGAFIGLIAEGSIGSQVVAAVLIAIGGTVAAMITYPFQAAVNGLLYADRRMRAEAFDLVLQTAAIEQQRQGWVHASTDDLWDPSTMPSGPVQPGHPGQGSPWSHS
jgi:hypothetical protein